MNSREHMPDCFSQAKKGLSSNLSWIFMVWDGPSLRVSICGESPWVLSLNELFQFGKVTQNG